MADVELLDAAEVSREDWASLQGIQRTALGEALSGHRSETEIDALVGIGDPARFAASHINPNTEVGRRFNDDQSYSRPRVAIAFDDDRMIGFAYAANNVSGPTERDRNLKRLSQIKNYFWLREIAVHPDHQGQGIARQLGAALLRKANILQPISAYIWPDEPGMERWESTLQRYQFASTGEQPVDLYNTGKKSVRQVRMQAPYKHALNMMPRGY